MQRAITCTITLLALSILDAAQESQQERRIRDWSESRVEEIIQSSDAVRRNEAVVDQSIGHKAEGADSFEVVEHLKVTSSTHTQFAATVVLAIGCDQEGNFYARLLRDGRGAATFNAPLYKISPDGKIDATFDGGNNFEEGNRTYGLGASITDDGDIYQIRWSEKRLPEAPVQQFIVRYSKDGSIKSKVKLESQGHTFRQVVAFKSGDLLVSGSADKGGAFTAVLDPGGKMLSNISDPDDEQPIDPVTPIDGSESKRGPARQSFDQGHAIAASDGNIYLMSSVSQPLIYAVSPSGQIVHKFRVDPGRSGLVPLSIFSSPGQLAIFFAFEKSQSSGGLLKVISFEGRPIATYDVDAGYLSCHAPTYMTVADIDAGMLVLNRVEPK